MLVQGAALSSAARVASGRSPEECPEWAGLRDAALRTTAATAPILHFSAVLALGVVNAGGRAGGLECREHQESLLGLYLFTLHWDWFPLALFLCVAVRPLSVFLLDYEKRLVERELETAVAVRTAFPVTSASSPPSSGQLRSGERAGLVSRRRLQPPKELLRPLSFHRRLLFLPATHQPGPRISLKSSFVSHY